VSRNITVDYWLNDGFGRFRWVSPERGLLDGEEKCALLVGDFDNDADLDIIQLTNEHLGRFGMNRYYVNDGKGYFTEQASARGLSGNTPFTDRWSKAAAGDFDNDGDLDLFYHNGLWTNDGEGGFSFSRTEGYYGRINGAGDLDGDGDLDLAGKRLYYESFPKDGFWVYRNDTDDDRWLIVNVVDGRLNPFGVGSKVYVYDGERLVGYRQVINAAAMQQPLEQHFGLGATRSVRVDVVFPDGSRAGRADVRAGQEITIGKDAGVANWGSPAAQEKPEATEAPSWVFVTERDPGCVELRWATPPEVEGIAEYRVTWSLSAGSREDSTVVQSADVVSKNGTSSCRLCFETAGRYCFSVRARSAGAGWSERSLPACADVSGHGMPRSNDLGAAGRE
jgi:hypothetical protein